MTRKDQPGGATAALALPTKDITAPGLVGADRAVRPARELPAPTRAEEALR